LDQDLVDFVWSRRIPSQFSVLLRHGVVSSYRLRFVPPGTLIDNVPLPEPGAHTFDPAGAYNASIVSAGMYHTFCYVPATALINDDGIMTVGLCEYKHYSFIFGLQSGQIVVLDASMDLKSMYVYAPPSDLDPNWEGTVIVFTIVI
jgi:hypothetical protein